MSKKTTSMQVSFAWSVTVKEVALIILMLGATTLFAYHCGQIFNHYKDLFFSGSFVVSEIIWILVSIMLLAITIGPVATLVRPKWLITVAFGLSALIILLFIKVSLPVLIICLLYIALGVTYTKTVTRRFENQINFSIHPLVDAQKFLLVILAVTVSASFALGYWEESSKNDVIIPQEFKQEGSKYLLSQAKTAIEKQENLPAQEIATAMEKATAEVNTMWEKLETSLKPVAYGMPILLAISMFAILQPVLMLLAWIPPLVLRGLFLLFNAIHFTGYKIENKEVKSLILE